MRSLTLLPALVLLTTAPVGCGDLWVVGEPRQRPDAATPRDPDPTDDAGLDPVMPQPLDAESTDLDAGVAPMLVDAASPGLPGDRTVFFSGHSLINLNSPSWFAQISQRSGRTVRYQLQMGIGAPLSVRLACPRSGQQADGNPIGYALLSELSRPGAYDTLVVTERHDIVTTILYESTTSMTRRFRDAVQSGSPGARSFLFESWYTVDVAAPDAFLARQARELPLWQCVASRVNETRGDAPAMLVVPAGQAIAELVTDVRAGRAPGFATLRDVFLDDVHLTADANYLISLIHYGVVHERAPSGLSYEGLSSVSGTGPTLTAEQARYLEALAARTVERTFAQAALSQQSESACAAAVTPPCVALLGANSCRGIAAALRNDTAPVPSHSGTWCLR